MRKIEKKPHQNSDSDVGLNVKQSAPEEKQEAEEDKKEEEEEEKQYSGIHPLPIKRQLDTRHRHKTPKPHPQPQHRAALWAVAMQHTPFTSS